MRPKWLATLSLLAVWACSGPLLPSTVGAQQGQRVCTLAASAPERDRQCARFALVERLAAWVIETNTDEVVIARGAARADDESPDAHTEWAFVRRGTRSTACEADVCGDVGRASLLGMPQGGVMSRYEGVARRVEDRLLLERVGARLRVVSAERATRTMRGSMVHWRTSRRVVRPRDLPLVDPSALASPTAWAELRALQGALEDVEIYGRERMVARTLLETPEVRLTLVTFPDPSREAGHALVLWRTAAGRVFSSSVIESADVRVDAVERAEAPFLLRVGGTIWSIGLAQERVVLDFVVARTSSREVSDCPHDPLGTCWHAQACERPLVWDDTTHAHLGEAVRQAWRIDRESGRTTRAQYIEGPEAPCPDERRLCLDEAGLRDCR